MKISAARSTVFLILVVIMASSLTGCATNTANTVDKQRVQDILLEADRTAADFQVILAGDPMAHKIQTIRTAMVPVILAVNMWGQNPDAPDPTSDVWAFIDIAQKQVITMWQSDIKKQRRALAIIAGVKLALRSAGLHAHSAIPPPPTISPPAGPNS